MGKVELNHSLNHTGWEEVKVSELESSPHEGHDAGRTVTANGKPAVAVEEPWNLREMIARVA